MFFGSVVGTAGGGGGVPASTYATLQFDGVDDYLDCGDDSSLEVGAADFTMFTFIRFSSVTGSSKALMSKWNSTGNQRSWELFFRASSNQLEFNYSTDGSSSSNFNVSWTPIVDTWYGVGITRAGADLKFWVDGVQVGATKDISTNTIFDSTANLVIGASQEGGSLYLPADLAAIKIIVGASGLVTELYNAGVPKVHRAYSSGIRDNTVLAIEGAEDLPTTQLETDLAAVTGLQLRSQANSGFNDISANAFTGTDNGSIVVNTDTLNVKDEWDFVPTDYLSYATDPAFEFAHTDSFSIVVAFNSDSITGSNQFLVAKAANSGQYEGYYLVTNASTQKVRMILQNNSGFTTIEAQGSTVLVNDKYYVATMTYDGSNAAAGIQLYINGVAESMSTLSNVAITSMTNSLPLIIGSRDGGGVPFAGQISEAMVFSKELTATEVRTVSDLLIERYLPKQDLEGNMIAENGTPTLTGAAIEFSEVQTPLFDVNAANLNGSSQSFTAPDSAKLSITGDITIALWVKVDALTADDGMVSKWNGSGNRSYLLWAYGVDSTLRFELSNNGTSSTVVQRTVPSLGGWHLIIATLEGTTMSLSVDDDVPTTNTHTGGIFDSNSPLTLGDYDTTSRLLDGSMAFPMIFDAALTSGEKTTLYNNGIPKCWDDLGALQTDCVYAPNLCNFDTNAGAELTDNSPSAITTTNVGSTPFTGTGLTVECS